MENAINTSGTVDNAILAKIAGLLKLAEKNNNANESASAAAAAQALLSKHRLTIADLGAMPGAVKEAPGVNENPLLTANRIAQWRTDLASAVCKANGCHYYFSKVFVRTGHGETRSRREYEVSIKLIGRSSDVEVVRYFYTYLEREVERLSAIAFAAGGIEGKRGGNSFKVGCVMTLATRLAESVRAARMEAGEAAQAKGEDGTMAMVRLDAADREVDEFYTTFTKGMNAKTRTSQSVQADAYSQGREAGKGIALNKGLDGGPVKMMN
jgi:hypothetical protein